MKIQIQGLATKKLKMNETSPTVFVCIEFGANHVTYVERQMTDGPTDRRTDGRTDRLMDGHMVRQTL